MHYVHIGMHKTGSTTIQRFLAENESVLEGLGYSYTATGRGRYAHHKLANSISRSSDESSSSMHSELKELVENSDQHVVLSSEVFEYFRDNQVAQLREILGTRKIKIILYIRSLDALIVSKYKQRTKTGINTLTFDEFFDVALDSRWFRMGGAVSSWASHFGAENVAVSQLEALDSQDDALLRRLWSDLDLPEDQFSTSIRGSVGRFNASPHWIAIEAIRSVNVAVNRTGISIADLEGAKKLHAKKEMTSSGKVETIHVGGLQQVCDDAIETLSLRGKSALYLSEEQNRKVVSFYNDEIEKIEKILKISLIRMKMEGLRSRDAMPSIEMLSPAERSQIGQFILRRPPCRSFPDALRQSIMSEFGVVTMRRKGGGGPGA